MSELNLSDKWGYAMNFSEKRVVYRQEDVREAVQKLKDRLDEYYLAEECDEQLKEHLNEFWGCLKEIFGPQLVGT